MTANNLKTYRGNCHCAKFVYDITLPEIKEYTFCKCSICFKKGYAWVSGALENVTFVKGDINDLASYTFNDAKYEHLFCPDCGTPFFCCGAAKPRGEPAAINIRPLQGIDLWSLSEKVIDEPRTRPPLYEPPVYTGPEPPAEMENAKIYHGSCHCGAVKVALKSKPLETLDISKDEERICDCNCSICVRNAYLWIYPATRDHTAIEGEEHLIWRTFNTTVQRKGFCKHCGVHIQNEPRPMTEREVEALSDFAKEKRDRKREFRNINLRILNDFDCTTLKPRCLDGWNLMTPGSYQNP